TFPRGLGECEMKRRSFAGSGIDPDAAAMPLDNPPADSQPDPRAFILVPAMKLLKNSEDRVVILLLDPDPVILHRKDPFGSLLLDRDVHLRRHLRPAELDGIADQILQ